MDKEQDKLIVVLVTTPNNEFAEKLSEELVQSHIAACVNIISNIRSIYCWKGALEKSKESLLIIKTTIARFKDLEQFIKNKHPYETPEIVSLAAQDVAQGYLNWVLEATS